MKPGARVGGLRCMTRNAKPDLSPWSGWRGFESVYYINRRTSRARDGQSICVRAAGDCFTGESVRPSTHSSCIRETRFIAVIFALDTGTSTPPPPPPPLAPLRLFTQRKPLNLCTHTQGRLQSTRTGVREHWCDRLRVGVQRHSCYITSLSLSLALLEARAKSLRD